MSENILIPPNFFFLLNDQDKSQYMYMRLAFACRANKKKRNMRINVFTEIMNAVRAFAIRGDPNDSARSLVCGVYWLHNGTLAINVRQLHMLIGQCKSSINGSLQRLGYNVSDNRDFLTKELTSALPVLRDNMSELRQWSFRTASTIQPIMPALPKITNTVKAPVELVDSPVEPTYDLEIPQSPPIDEDSKFDRAVDTFIEDATLWDATPTFDFADSSIW